MKSQLHKIISIEVRREPDVVMARQRARQVAALLKLEMQDQVRVATSTSELARNAFRYADGGRVEFSVDMASPQSLVIQVTDSGPGIPQLKKILDGRYRSTTGMGLGILGAKRLMDGFHIETEPGQGTRVQLRKHLIRRHLLTARDLAKISDELARQAPENPYAEMQLQNQELMRALEQLQARQAELTQLNAELEDTNRGVVALYAELDDKAAFLQRANELKSRFFSNMSHEFRTPLHTIVSIARILLDRMDGDLTSEQEKQVTFILQAAQNLSQMVDDLLDLAKVEAGKVPVHPAEFEVASLFGALRGMLRPLVAANQSVALIFEEPVDVPPIFGDEGKISQILRNFISNALKFTPKGEVRVTARRGRAGMVEFTVEDTGIGIESDNLDRIFEEWTQVENPLQRKFKGSGLGLPLSRRLAELMGGSVQVESEPGAGSRFTVEVPLRYQGTDELQLHPTIAQAALPVLVLQERGRAGSELAALLADSDFEPIFAMNVKQAQEATRRGRLVAVIVNASPETRPLWKFVAELKESPEAPPLVVIGDEASVGLAANLRADAISLAPVSREWLLGQLQQFAIRQGENKILLIDDEEASRYVLRGWLPPHLTVVEADGGREGLKLAAREHPRAIFLDLMMEDMNGFEVLERLKANPNTRDIPVIVNSGKKLTDQDMQRLSSATAVLSKQTASVDDARSAVRKALARAGVTEQEEVRHA